MLDRVCGAMAADGHVVPIGQLLHLLFRADVHQQGVALGRLANGVARRNIACHDDLAGRGVHSLPHCR